MTYTTVFKAGLKRPKIWGDPSGSLSEKRRGGMRGKKVGVFLRGSGETVHTQNKVPTKNLIGGRLQ